MSKAGSAEVVSMIAVFDTDEHADEAIQRLRSAGVPQENIIQISSRTGGRSTQSGDDADDRDMTDDAAIDLIELGVPDEDADLIISTLDDGSAVVALIDIRSDAVPMLIDALDIVGAMDLNARWRSGAASRGQQRRTRLQSQAGIGRGQRQLMRRQDENMRVRTYRDLRHQVMDSGTSDVEVEDQRAASQSGRSGTDSRS